MYSFIGVQRENYFGGEPIRRIEVEARVEKLKNRKEEVSKEMVKGGDDMLVDWVWRLCKWWSVWKLYKVKDEKTECKNYRGINLLSVVGKIYKGILVNWVCGVTEGLIDDDQGGFRSGSMFVDLIFNLK